MGRKKKTDHNLEDQSHFGPCSYSGCLEPGVYPAPKSKQEIYDYIFFCAEHIRTYNASWNYYKGVEGEELLKHILADAQWRRPTWKPGKPPILNTSAIYEIDDIFKKNRWKILRDIPNFSPLEKQHMKSLDLEWPFNLENLRKKYRELVRKYHPDLNQGNKNFEEKLKNLNEAYVSLKKMFSNN